MSAPEDVYELLTSLFEDRKDKVYDFEILPSGFGPLLQDGRSIGITKKTLAQAFLVARRNFFDSSRDIESGLPQAARSNTPEITSQHHPDTLEHSTLHNTAIILLFDPEHLTASNWRKQRLLRILKASSDPCVSTFLDEITFTTTLLRSPLHRHSKSPTLWHHRFWVVSQLFSRDDSQSLALVGSVLYQDGSHYASLPLIENAERIVQGELSVVLKSGERHRMNYYAFSYMRQFIGLLRHALEHASVCCYSRNKKTQLHPSSQAATLGEESPIPIPRVVKGKVLLDMHAWCLAHPGDTSGWSFLHFLMDIGRDPETQRTVVEKTVHFARDVQWEGESLWAFVDSCVTNFGVSLNDSSAPAMAAEERRDEPTGSKSPH